VHYSVDAGMQEWDTDGKSMQIRLNKVLKPGKTCSYEYDFGSTTGLLVKVITAQEVDMKGRAIQVLARNTLPIILCDVCGSLRSHCIYEDKRGLCDACSKSYECGE
jgi:hypothetical protein